MQIEKGRRLEPWRPCQNTQNLDELKYILLNLHSIIALQDLEKKLANEIN